MDIKEIALRIGEEADEYADAKLQSKGESHPNWHTVRDEYFAEALVAELAKQNEPVARVNGYYSGHPVIMPLVKYVFPVGLALFTFPPTAEQIANETAEVIAEYCRNQDHYCLATEIENGAWKEFKK